MKHTQGPWAFRKDYNGVFHIDSENGKAWIARTVPPRDLTTGAAIFDTEADARLISAAPDLLEACKRLLDAFYEDPLENDTASAVELAYDAIAKATGEDK